MQTLSIDLETYSDQPLAKTGVYRYVESPDFEILLFAYSVDGGPVQQIDLEMLDGLGGVYGTALIPGGGRRCAGIGKTEAV